MITYSLQIQKRNGVLKQVIIEIFINMQHEMKSHLFGSHYPQYLYLKLPKLMVITLIKHHLLSMITLIMIMKLITPH